MYYSIVNRTLYNETKWNKYAFLGATWSTYLNGDAHVALGFCNNRDPRDRHRRVISSRTLVFADRSQPRRVLNVFLKNIVPRYVNDSLPIVTTGYAVYPR